MNQEAASKLVQQLVSRTSGWDDQSVADYTADLSRLANDEAAVRAVRNVCDQWTGNWRPAWGVIRQAYESEVQRRTMSKPQLPGTPAAPPARARVLMLAAKLMDDGHWIDGLYLAEDQTPPAHNHGNASGLACPRCDETVLKARWEQAKTEAERRLAVGAGIVGKIRVGTKP